MTFPSAHHSPKTVNKKASEFVIGTVMLSSITCQHILPQIHSPKKLSTGLPDYQKEPDAPSQIQKQRNRIAGTPQQIKHSVEGAQHLSLDPTISRRIDGRPLRRVEVDCCAADEGRC